VTAIRLAPYTLASAAAAVPYVCLFTYLGAVSTDLYELLHDSARAHLTPQLLVGLACVMVLSAAGLFLVCRHVVRDAGGDRDRARVGAGGGAAAVDDADGDADGAAGEALGRQRRGSATASEARSLLPTVARNV
jgi:hypothetical protein